MSGGGLIIGYGNPLRGDDGVGCHVAILLNERTGRDWRVLNCHQLTPELAAAVAGAAWVIYVDAAQSRPPGEIRMEAVPDQPPGANPWTHKLEPASLQQLARTLYGRVPQAALCTVGGVFFGYEQGLSSAVDRAIPRVLEAIDGQIEVFEASGEPAERRS